MNVTCYKLPGVVVYTYNPATLELVIQAKRAQYQLGVTVIKQVG